MSRFPSQARTCVFLKEGLCIWTWSFAFIDISLPGEILQLNFAGNSWRGISLVGIGVELMAWIHLKIDKIEKHCI